MKYLISICEYLIYPNLVFKKLSTLNVNKSTGPDALLPLLLKNCAYLTDMLTMLLINQSLDSTFFAQHWKENYITPILKQEGKIRCLAIQTCCSNVTDLKNL